MENFYRKKIKVCCVTSVDMTLKFMLFSQLKFLQSQGYDVYAVCSSGKWVKDIEKEGIKVKTIEISRKMISPISDLIAFVKLFLYFKKESFDIIHVHTPKAEVYGQIAAKLAGIPIIINTLHGFGSDLPDAIPSWQKNIYLWLQKVSGKYSLLVFSISNDIIEKVKNHEIFPPEKIVYLGRDIDTERFNPERYSREFVKLKKDKLGIDYRSKIIGIIARMVGEKGYIELFEAFSKVLERFPDSLLLVIGQQETSKKDAIGPDTARKYGIEKRVKFLGERTDTEELYSTMDIFVLPSHREGLGAVALEASSMEIPVVATRVGGLSEAVENGKTGILVPVKNPTKLAEALLRLLEHPDKAKTMGLLGREKVIKEFRKDIILGRLGKEYEKLIMRGTRVKLEEEWFLNYSRAAKDKRKEYEIMFHSKTGFRNDNLYFFDYFKNHIKNKEHNSGKKILDVGCGFGDSIGPLAELGFNCFGVDYVAEIIEAAKKKYKNVNFQVADAYNLPFENNSFDFVICKGVFQVLSSPQKAIEELKRVLKQDGFLIIITLNIFALDKFFQKNNVVRYNPYAFKSLLRINGFDKFKLKGVYVMPGFLDFVADFLINLKIHCLFNFLFPIFAIFSHNFYLESKKK